MMMTIAGYEYGDGGRYKIDDNMILGVDAEGTRRVRFRPTPAVDTSHDMEQLELAYMAARSDANINQLLLYKNGYDVGKYVSFEEQINNFNVHYYEALRQSSEGWQTGENSYFPFVENFLSMFYMCYKELDKRFAVVNGKKITKRDVWRQPY